MTKPTCQRPGFTVTELLVVISILIVLAALVFAGARRATEAANASVCMNNLKQVAVQQLALCHENNGVILHAHRTKVRDSWARSWQLYHAILQSDNLTWRSSNNDVNKEAELLTYLRCPTAYRVKRSEMDNLTGWKKVSTYAMNGLIGSDFDPESGTHPWIRGARSIGDINDPSELVMAIEKEWASWGVYGNGAGPADKVHVFADFHNGGFNVAFYDGHVERGKHGKFPIWTKKSFKWGDEEYFRNWLGSENFR